MKLIIGLGNPGTQYEKTRHNVGFLFLDFFIEKNHFSGEWKNENKFKGEIFETFFQGEKTILLKPQTFMNLSGESVLKMMSFYKIPKENILVIYDDISLEPGKVRYRESGSAGGQNGVKSIIAHIGEDFKRIKIGIGQDKTWDLSDWVLSKFSHEELENLKNDIFPKAHDILIDKI